MLKARGSWRQAMRFGWLALWVAAVPAMGSPAYRVEDMVVFPDPATARLPAALEGAWRKTGGGTPEVWVLRAGEGPHALRCVLSGEGDRIDMCERLLVKALGEGVAVLKGQITAMSPDPQESGVELLTFDTRQFALRSRAVAAQARAEGELAAQFDLLVPPYQRAHGPEGAFGSVLIRLAKAPQLEGFLRAVVDARLGRELGQFERLDWGPGDWSRFETLRSAHAVQSRQAVEQLGALLAEAAPDAHSLQMEKFVQDGYPTLLLNCLGQPEATVLAARAYARYGFYAQAAERRPRSAPALRLDAAMFGHIASQLDEARSHEQGPEPTRENLHQALRWYEAVTASSPDAAAAARRVRERLQNGPDCKCASPR